MRLRIYSSLIVSIMTFPLIGASASAAEGDWTIGPRTLPAPIAASEALRSTIASIPAPDVATSSSDKDIGRVIGETDDPYALLVELTYHF